MKRKLLLLTCTLLLLSGCGADDDATTASSSSEPQPTETATEFDEEYYLELIPEVKVEVAGIWMDGWEDQFCLYLTTPTITEFSADYLIAEGILSNEWHATEEAVSVKYYISEGSIFSCDPIPDEALLLTPAIPFSTDLLYDLYEEAVYYDATGTKTYVDFTPENFPGIEMDNAGWHCNYDYYGVITITDVKGNVYQASPSYGYIFYNSRSKDSEERYWEAGSEGDGDRYIFVQKIE